MKDLRSLIKEVLLLEQARRPDDLPNNIGIGIEVTVGSGGEPGYRTQYVYSDSKLPVEDDIPFGKVVALQMGTTNHPYVVVSSMASKSWGPLLYDVTMELAGSVGLMADRQSVSPFAHNIWYHYDKKRPDVVSQQWDDFDNTLTPTNDDNVDQESAAYDEGLYDWPRSPLSRSFIAKGTPTIDRLQALGKLFKLK